MLELEESGHDLSRAEWRGRIVSYPFYWTSLTAYLLPLTLSYSSSKYAICCKYKKPNIQILLQLYSPQSTSSHFHNSRLHHVKHTKHCLDGNIHAHIFNHDHILLHHPTEAQDSHATRYYPSSPSAPLLPPFFSLLTILTLLS